MHILDRLKKAVSTSSIHASLSVSLRIRLEIRDLCAELFVESRDTQTFPAGVLQRAEEEALYIQRNVEVD